MTDEERRRTMDFILAQQAQFWAGMQKLEESQARAESRLNGSDRRLDRLEAILKLMIQAGRRARQRMREQDASFEQNKQEFWERFAADREAAARTDRKIEELVQSSARTDQRIAESSARTDQKIAESSARTDQKIAESSARADQKIAALAESRAYADQKIAELAKSSAHADQKIAELAESQAHTDKRLAALIDIVREQRNGES